jgi:hypothetical protein
MQGRQISGEGGMLQEQGLPRHATEHISNLQALADPQQRWRPEECACDNRAAGPFAQLRRAHHTLTLLSRVRCD